MEYLNCDDKHNIYSIQRTGASGHYNINWETIGFESFIIIYGEEQREISLDTSPDESKLKKWLEMHCNSLMENECLIDNNLGIKVYIENFATFRQKGGFSVSGQPGAYAIYGIIEETNNIKIYIPADNVFQLSVDINIEDEAVYMQKGFFNKRDVYAGYHKVTVKDGINGLKNGTVYYTVGDRIFKYPVPMEITNRGGTFFVKCDESSSISFGTTNRAGVRIR